MDVFHGGIGQVEQKWQKRVVPQKEPVHDIVADNRDHHEESGSQSSSYERDPGAGMPGGCQFKGGVEHGHAHHAKDEDVEQTYGCLSGELVEKQVHQHRVYAYRSLVELIPGIVFGKRAL